MGKNHTVGEVCKLTGLTRKKLYTYDKEGIVKATGYKNSGHEGRAWKSGVMVNYDGYKLYNEEAVRKLQIISIYEKLKMKKGDIKKRFTSREWNETSMLEEQIRLLQEEKKKIEELIIVAEQLKMFGTKGILNQYYAVLDFSKAAQNDTYWKEAESLKRLYENAGEELEYKCKREVEKTVEALMNIPPSESGLEKTEKVIAKLFKITKKRYGLAGLITLSAMAVAADGGGDAFNEFGLYNKFDEKVVSNAGKAMLEYLTQEIALLYDSWMKIVNKYHMAIGKDFEEPSVKEMVEEMRMLLLERIGIQTKEEYDVLIEFVQQTELDSMDIKLEYVVKAIKYYC